jgi:hypothetical protein
MQVTCRGKRLGRCLACTEELVVRQTASYFVRVHWYGYGQLRGPYGLFMLCPGG